MADSDLDLDTVQHPTLGALKFPKDMPFDQRNQSIQWLERQQASAPPPMPQPPDVIMRAADEPGLLTGPIDVASKHTFWGGDPAAQQVLAREVKAGVDTVTGIPSAIYHAFKDKPTQEEEQQYGGPEQVSGAKRIGLGLHRLITQPVETAYGWYKDVAHGKVPDAYDQALSVAPEAIGSGAATALLSEAPKAEAGVLRPIAEQVRQLRPEAPRLVKSAGIGLSPTEKLVKAGGPSVTDANFPEKLQTAQARLIEQNKISPIKSVQDLADGAGDAAQRIWKTEVEPQIARHANETINGRVLAQQIVNNISEGTADLFPKEADQALNFAATLERDIPLAKANQYLIDLNARLKSFYKMSPEARAASRVTDGQISAWESAADGLRDQIYGKLSDLGEADPRGLRQQYGALKDIQKVFGKRAIVAGRQAPINIQQALSLLVSGHPMGAFALATGLRYLNSPDVLVQRGISGLTPGATSAAAGKVLRAAAAVSAVSPRKDQSLKGKIDAIWDRYFGSKDEAANPK